MDPSLSSLTQERALIFTVQLIAKNWSFIGATLLSILASASNNCLNHELQGYSGKEAITEDCIVPIILERCIWSEMTVFIIFPHRLQTGWFSFVCCYFRKISVATKLSFPLHTRKTLRIFVHCSSKRCTIWLTALLSSKVAQRNFAQLPVLRMPRIIPLRSKRCIQLCLQLALLSGCGKVWWWCQWLLTWLWEWIPGLTLFKRPGVLFLQADSKVDWIGPTGVIWDQNMMTSTLTCCVFRCQRCLHRLRSVSAFTLKATFSPCLSCPVSFVQILATPLCCEFVNNKDWNGVCVQHQCSIQVCTELCQLNVLSWLVDFTWDALNGTKIFVIKFSLVLYEFWSRPFYLGQLRWILQHNHRLPVFKVNWWHKQVENLELRGSR